MTITFGSLLSRVFEKSHACEALLEGPFKSSSMKESPSLVLKIGLIGDVSVGKDSLLNQHIDGQFRSPTPYNSGIDIRVVNYRYKKETIKVVYWILQHGLTAKNYYSLSGSYFRGLDSYWIVFDRANNEINCAIFTLGRIYKKIEKQKANANALKILIAAKSDLNVEKQTSELQIQKLAECFDIPYFLTSAKNNENVKELFHFCLTSLLESKKNT